ncbi:MAG TPA: WD40 repeat domain-containing protein, partial [Isosphaeraceae bacterium]|nr:WD40 repeat domain-containing protein [Isosphaeraceae bacterium]
MRLPYLSRLTFPALMLATLGLVHQAQAQQAELVGTFDGHVEPVYSVSWTPDATRLVSGGFDNTIRIWDVASRKELAKREGHGSLVLAVSVSPDGKQIASGSLDKTVRLWAMPPSGPAAELANLAGPVKALARSNDGKTVALGAGAVVKIWDPANPQARDLNGHASEVQAIAWRNDGQQIASGDKSHAIRLWNPADGASQGIIETPADAVLALAFTPNNQQVVSGGSDGIARLWQLPVEEPKNVEARSPVKLT